MKLDHYEQHIYNDLTSKGIDHDRALRVLINSVEGDYSQLSKGLYKYGKEKGILIWEN